MTTGGAWIAIVTSIIAGLAGFAALIRTFLERPKYRADAMTLVTQAATDQMATLRGDNDDVRKRLASVEQKLASVEEKLDLTQDQLDDAQRLNRQLRQQLRVLMQHARRAQEWSDKYYNAGHPPGMQPPPRIPYFDDTLFDSDDKDAP
jgi:septal ring factor EnvC (AmiA/AmiB activator)